MNKKLLVKIAGATLSLASFYLPSSTIRAQGTAFTYQGQLQNNGSPANGAFNLTFSLFNVSTGGAAIAGPLTNAAVIVSNGLFTTLVDFGPEIFTGSSTWVQLGVATNGTSTFATLTPRQQLTPAPYAIYAEAAGSALASQLISIGNSNGGGNNFFIGPAGNATMSGGNNIAIGVDALGDNTTGFGNTANGNYALNQNTSGLDNTADGADSLANNTSGSENTANGYYALAFNTTGNGNTANGIYALYANTNGLFNTASGLEALFSNTSGSYNTASGESALYSNTTGSYNTALGSEALQFNTNGIDNTAVGLGALLSNTSGYDNTAIGVDALAFNTIGSFNTAEGNSALQSNTSGDHNMAVGYSALFRNTNGSFNIALGEGALYSSTNGSNNIALGFFAGDVITSGNFNIDIGNQGLSTDSSIIRIGDVQTATYLAGTVYANGVALTSDRHAKENFQTLDFQEVLAKVLALPVTQWNYKTDSKDVQHIGPMAQDFKAAFGLAGRDDTHISVVDESGIALAAIQGLNQKVEAQRSQLEEKQTEITELKQRLEKLESRIKATEGVQGLGLRGLSIQPDRR